MASLAGNIQPGHGLAIPRPRAMASGSLSNSWLGRSQPRGVHLDGLLSGRFTGRTRRPFFWASLGSGSNIIGVDVDANQNLRCGGCFHSGLGGGGDGSLPFGGGGGGGGDGNLPSGFGGGDGGDDGEGGNSGGGGGGDGDDASVESLVLFALKKATELLQSWKDHKPLLQFATLIERLAAMIFIQDYLHCPQAIADHIFSDTRTRTITEEIVEEGRDSIGFAPGMLHGQFQHARYSSTTRKETLEILTKCTSATDSSSSRSLEDRNGFDTDEEEGSEGSNGSDEDDDEKKKKEAMLAFVFRIADKLPPALCGLAYLLLRQAISGPWSHLLVGAVATSVAVSIPVLGAASYYKELELPDHPGLGRAATLVLLELQLLYVASILALHGCGDITSRTAWLLGPAGLCLIALAWLAFIQRPKTLIGWMKAISQKMTWKPRCEPMARQPV